MMKQLRKVLCVDDEKDILQVAKVALETIGGFEVFVCASGREALAQVEDIRPDVILLDAMMPQMDGPATLLKLHKIQELKTIPIIFMTARVQPSEIEEYRALGASGVISKPFDPMVISQEIRAQWEQFHKARKTALEALIAPLRRDFLVSVKETRGELEAALTHLETNGDLPHEQLQALRSKAHGLSGSGATFGFDDVTRTAHELEMALKAKQDKVGNKNLNELIEELMLACEKALQSAI